MRQSNWILGIGILVAMLLIAGSFFLKAAPTEEAKDTLVSTPTLSVDKSIKSIITLPLNLISAKIQQVN